MYRKGQKIKMTRDCSGGGFERGDVFTLTQDHERRAVFVDNDGVYRSRDCGFELVTPALTTGKFYRTASGAVTGRVTNGDTGFEAVVDGKVRIFDAAGGAVHGGDDIVEEWVPKVGERVVEAAPKQYDFVAHWRDFWQGAEGPIVEDAFVVTKVSGNFVHYSNRVGGNGPQATLDCFEPLPVAAPQPAAQEPALKIEAGRYYKTRDGRKVGPMYVYSDGWSEKGDSNCRMWRSDGRRYYNNGPDSDLVAEWVDAPTAPVSAQVDAIAEEYGPARAATTSDDDDIVEMSIGELTMAIADALRVAGKKTAKKPVKIGDAVTLSAPARIAGIDKKNAMVVLDTGGSFALPLAALRAA